MWVHTGRLDGPGSNPGGDDIFHTRGAQPVYYTMSTRSFPGVKQPGPGVYHSPHLAPRLKKEYSYISTPNLGLRGLLYGELHFNFTEK
jgi:hypothetical protein